MNRPEPATAKLRPRDTGVGSVFVSNYPPFSFWSGEALAEVEKALERPAPEEPLGLYLHIPFCRKRCKFCYFRVYTDKSGSEIGRYVEAMAREVELYAARPAVAGRALRFVYFGGGTPSYISVRHLRALVERLRAALPWEDVEEVTFECEPGTLTRSKLEAIREIGVTRLSLGIENFDDEILRANGRAHISTEIYRVLPWIEELGFAQLNVDLISGMVGERWESWKETVRKTVEAAPDSVTVYQMELPFNAVFSAQLEQGGLGGLADWETKRAWHAYAFEQLAAAGYEPSSAYTMIRRGSGARFVYRDAVWHGRDMLGVGVSSFSHLGGLHFQNTADWATYLERLEAGRPALERGFVTSARDRMIRELILQLKTGRIDPAYFQAGYGVDVVREFAPVWDELETEGLLRQAGPETVELAPEGLLQVDFLLPAFYDRGYRGGRYT